MNNTKTVPDQDDTLYTSYQAQAWDTSNSLALVSIHDDRPLEPQTTLLPMAITLVSTLIALVFLVRLWKNRGSLFERLFWTVFLFVPVFGPLFFLVFYPSPTELEAKRWASMSSVNRFGGGGGMGL